VPGVARMVGRYEVVREIGRGGMAVVHLARQVDLDRWVALKELGAFQAAEPSLAQRFVRESRVAGSLSHPNIVTVHDFFEYERTPYIAMEYLSQGSLRPYMRGLSLPQLVGLLEGVLAGLAHAEARGVVHRDLKPENLMVTDDGRVKITDFGIAKATDRLQSTTFQTAAGTAVGTPAYIAPEQALGEEVGPWTDLYSVGCIAYEGATGRLPFGDSPTPAALLLRHVNQPVVPPRLVRPGLEASLSDWIERLLAKAPSDRTRSAADAWDSLEDIAIQVLVPRWRRDARLPASGTTSSAAPLRPAAFGSG
jgi:serine/threonine protein kinase